MSAVGVVVAVGWMFAGSASASQAPVNLRSAASFAVLAGSGVTNTGPTTVDGDVGTYATTSETGFGSVTFAGGANQDGDGVTQTAKGDLTTAYNDAAGRTPVTNVPVELGGTTLGAGVYRSPTLGLTGTVTLDANGNPDAVFIFQAGSTLITASNSQVLLTGGANACNVVWQVGSSATFGTGSQFTGNVLAAQSITATTGATFQGRLLAEAGAITLDTNTITASNCASSTSTPTPTATTTPTVTASSAGNGPASSITSARATGGATTPGGLASPLTDAQAALDRRGTAGASRSSGGTIPFTGLPTGRLLGLALVLITLGALTATVGRRLTLPAHPGPRHRA